MTGPISSLNRWDQSDMHSFDAWARSICGGDWLTNRSLHPLVQWELSAAELYFKDHPDPARALLARHGFEADPTLSAQSLWNGWYGEKRFHQEPLYPYLLATSYALFGPEPAWAIAFQMLVGSITVALIFLCSHRYFGALAAAVAGFTAALYGPLLFYDALLLREGLICFATLGLLHLTELGRDERSTRFWLVTGLAMGLAVLLKSTFVLFAPALVIAALSSRMLARGQAIRSMCAFLIGIGLALCPLLARNLHVGVSPLSLSSIGAIGFMLNNCAGNAPEQGFQVNLRATVRILHETGGEFLPTVVATLRTHPNMASLIALLRSKVTALGHWYELPDNANFHWAKEHSVALRLAFCTFFFVAPLGIIGACISLPTWRRCWPLHYFLVATAAPMLVFLVGSRYRLPLAALLIPFAGLSLQTLVGWFRSFAWRPLVAFGIMAGLLVLWVGRSMPADRSPIRLADVVVPYNLYYRSRLEEALRAGDWIRARALVGETLQHEPTRFGWTGVPGTGSSPADCQSRQFYASVRLLQSRILARLADRQSSSDAQRHAERLRSPCP